MFQFWMTLNAYLNRFSICETFEQCEVVECLQHFDGIIPSVASILMKQHSIRDEKYLLKTLEMPFLRL